MPTQFSKQKENMNEYKVSENNDNKTSIQWIDLWQKFDKRGFLDDSLLDILWRNVIEQKVS